MSEHVETELVPLLLGELGREQTIMVAGHLRSCPTCASELVATVIAHGSLRAAARAGAALDSSASATDVPRVLQEEQSEQPPLRFLAKRSFRQPLRRRSAGSGSLVRVAAVALVIAAAGIGWFVASGSGPAPVAATATLARMVAPSDANGTVVVRIFGADRQMSVATGHLPAAPANDFYEVWLLQPATNKMLPVGVLSPTGSGSYTISATIMSQYGAIDISLQANNGNPAHSKTSVLRGNVSPV
jgi:hypothetical protein